MKETAEQTKEISSRQEKTSAALTSVVAAIFLISIKLIVGMLTGSLGILAEAAHSGLDLLAAAVTFFAVKISDRPADSTHTYGHGKIENLSALFEAVLLLITCVWIIYEAISRLFFKQVKVEATLWSFLVMSGSIIVDFSRSRILKRVAKKYGSQALEADAIHFSTDILSSAVVIGGLALILVSKNLGIPWLVKADSIAAMIVAVIVTYIGMQLGRRAVAELLDEVPNYLQGRIAQSVCIPGVVEIRQVRVRRSGSKYFADIALAISRSTSSEQAHQIADQAEKAVQALLPDASVLIHVDPIRTENEQLPEALRIQADQFGFGIHNIQIREVRGQQILTLHLDTGEELRLEEAHKRASAFEDAVLKAYPGFDQVWTHLEPRQRQINIRTGLAIPHDENLEQLILDLPRVADVPCEIHDITILKETKYLGISFRCLIDGDLSIDGAHKLSEHLETVLRAEIAGLDQVLIHMEPLR